jgi:hypothetical protein
MSYSNNRVNFDRTGPFGASWTTEKFFRFGFGAVAVQLIEVTWS